MLRIAFLLSFLFLAFTPLKAQFAITQVNPYDGNLNQVLQDNFFGEGIKVSNAEFKGVDVQFGTFRNANATIGLQEGIVLSTGRVEEIVGRDDTASSVLIGLPNRVAMDADLKMLSDFLADTLNDIYTGFVLERPDNMQEAAILEFDVQTTGNSLNFDYVFGSDEYSQWINTRFVDVMGIFVSGPGINGPYSNGAINVATLPNGRLPLSVNSTHNGNANFDPLNPQFYKEKNNENLAFGGYTIPLKNTLLVAPCTQYHIKIAVADGSLPDKDSGIFLKKQGISSDALSVRLLPNNAVSFVDSLYQEGCALVAAELTFPPVTFTQTYQQFFSGASQAGVADMSIENTVVQRVNDKKDTIFYAINLDFIAEGTEQASFTFTNSSGCTVVDKDFTFYIQDRATLIFDDFSTDTLLYTCGNEKLRLAEPTNYTADLEYSWSDNVPENMRSDSAVNITPTLSEESFVLTVTDTCSDESIKKRFVILRQDAQMLEINIAEESISFDCPGEIYLPNVDINGGTAPFIFNINYHNQSFTDSVLQPVIANTTAMYILKISDACAQLSSDTVFINVPNYQPVSLGIESSLTEDGICVGDFVGIKLLPQGGDGNYSFFKDGQILSSDSTNLQITQDTGFVFELRDGCNSSVTSSISFSPTLVNAEFDVRYIAENAVQCINFSEGADGFTWLADSVIFSTDLEPQYILESPENVTLTLIASNVSGCSDTATLLVEPVPRYYIPNAFTPDGDGFNDCFKPVGQVPDEYLIEVFDRWGGIVYSSTDWNECWDGNHPKNAEAVNGIYVLKMFVRFKNINETYTGRIQVLR